VLKIAALVLAVAAVVFGARCVGIRKDLVTERQTIGADWSQVNNALERRTALTPVLTKIVMSELPNDITAGVETQAVTNACRDLQAAPGQHQKIQANARLDEALARLMLLVEAHPKIESSKQYGDVLEALKGAEYQIAVARRKYNEAVEHYNARLDGFPENLVSSVARLGKIDAYFQTAAP